ncbi:MAG TPA: YlxR family protein [Jatrophihabitans sp.]|nr:YlxR family protein [Jatrophihabitans sp.]
MRRRRSTSGRPTAHRPPPIRRRQSRWTILAKAGSRLINGRPRDGDIRAAGPVRTCIGCRQRAVVTDLLRVVVDPRTRPAQDSPPVPAATGPLDVLPDPRHHAPGRGAWLHPRLDCMERAERRRAFGRALRCSAPLEVGAVRSYLERLG